MQTDHPLNARFRRARARCLVSDLSTLENRRRARTYALWYDHEILRIPWSNRAEIAPGVWRSNAPTHQRLLRMRDRLGLASVLCLRGANRHPTCLREEQSCRDLGLHLHFAELRSRHAPDPDTLLHLIEIFRRIEKPFLMHCKSGADRASLAAAIYLLTMERAPLPQARAMFSPRFLHFKWTKTGILDAFLDAYESRRTRGAIGFAEWIRTEYDPIALQSAFDKDRACKKKRPSPPPCH